MSKKRTTISLDEELLQQLQADETVNVSGTVNMLLRQYLNGDRGEEAMLELRRDQLQSDLRSARVEVESKEEELENVEERLTEIHAQTRDTREDVLPEAADVFVRMPQSALTEDNEAVKNWARKADIPPAELLDWYRTEYDDGGGD